MAKATTPVPSDHGRQQSPKNLDLGKSHFKTFLHNISSKSSWKKKQIIYLTNNMCLSPTNVGIATLVKFDLRYLHFCLTSTEF